MRGGATATSLRSVFLLAAAASLSTTEPSVAAGTGFILLVHRSNTVPSLTRSDVKRLTTGVIKQWDSGAVVQLGIIPDQAPETQYLAALVDMSTRELLSRIQEGVFKGELRRPMVLRASADCVAFARSSPGALCVAAEGEALPEEARVVTVR